MDNDFWEFCARCSWYDYDHGCTSPPYEEVYQCPMYMHYHPEEVKKFDEAMEKWEKRR